MFWHFDVIELSSDVISGRGSKIFEKQPLRLRLSFVVFSIFLEFLNWILKLTYWTRFCMYRFVIQTGSTELEPPELRGYLKYFYAFKGLFTCRFQFILQNINKLYVIKLVQPKIYILYLYVFIFGHPNKRPK